MADIIMFPTMTLNGKEIPYKPDTLFIDKDSIRVSVYLTEKTFPFFKGLNLIEAVVLLKDFVLFSGDVVISEYNISLDTVLNLKLTPIKRIGE